MWWCGEWSGGVLIEFGAHLPLADFGGHPYSIEHLIAYAEAADRLGFTALAANDHFVYPVPWLDGLTALAAVMAHSGAMSLATTVSLPVVRGPVPLAKTLGAIDRLSGGRTVVAVDAGSSVGDYEAVGLDFGERWKRLDEAVQAMRALWREEEEEFSGQFYSTEGITLRPYPAQPFRPPIWIGSWGSDPGLRRVAHLGDGWLASAYNTTPELFRDSWDRLRSHLVSFDKDPERFPNGLATMFCYITEDSSEAERVFTERFFPISNRPQEMLRERLAIGPAEDFVEKLIAYRDAGVQRVFIWPVGDEVRQLELFKERVAPQVMR